MSMRLIFTPKHQKLVNNCYPKGRTPDMKPKSSETSYLLYYVNSRRSKLEKVSTYLVKRSTADLRHRRAGPISVTLDLMNRIVIHCKENLNIFVKDFLEIMVKVLSDNNFNNDINLMELVEHTLRSICDNLDDALSSGDPGFIQLYQTTVDLFFKVAKERVRNDDLLLQGCIDISHTPNLASNPQINRLISESVSIALAKFKERNPQYASTDLDNTSFDYTLSKGLSRTQTGTVGLGDIAVDREDLSVQALGSYFNTAETDKLTLALRTLIRSLLLTPNKDLLEFICDGIPVQLRYIAIILLIRQLNEPNKSSESSKNVITSLKLISSLLVSDVSIFGLSILDIMRKLLHFQINTVEDQNIVHQCAITITDLNTKVYYGGQTADMFYELLSRLRVERREGVHRALLKDIDTLVIHTKQKCISLDLFVELGSFIPKQLIKLFDLVEDDQPIKIIPNKFFDMLREAEDEEVQQMIFERAFDKYKSVILLSGLKYFTDHIEQPEPCYYMYHKAAAKFLEIHDYFNQAVHRQENNVLFTTADLLNFYSDDGSNQYSAKGTKILMKQENQLSNFDLTAQSLELQPPPADLDGTSITSPVSNISLATMGNDPSGNKEATYRHLSGDARSLKNLRTTTPTVLELKKAFGRKRNLKGTNSVRGAQSLQSKVTNITFLLSELKSGSEETNKIHVPDEDDIIGLDKSDLVRSNSTRLDPVTSRNSSNRNSIMRRADKDTDSFKDAAEEIDILSSRGKLFTSV